MSWHSSFLVLSASAAMAVALQTTAVADPQVAVLHEPLPAYSLQQNGTPQELIVHPANHKQPAALPGGGLHPNAKAGLHRRYSGTPIDVLNYHYDAYPTGWNQSETDLTPATVGSSSFGQLTTLNVDGNVFAQPLIVSNFVMPDGTTHNVLIIATGHNSVYAFDEQTYSILWQVNLGTSQSTNHVGCGDVQPEYGISSTPVIVRTAANAGTIYVVAATEPASYSFHTQLHALNLATGADVVAPVEIAPKAKLETGGKIGFDPQNQWNRASLVYANNSIYMGIGSHCDNNAGDISGWVLRYGTDLTLQDKFNTIEASAGYELSSVWMSGFAPAVDGQGNVYVVTGNGNYNLGKGAKGYGESVLKLTSDLKIHNAVDSTFTPANYVNLNDGDKDFGSGGVMLLPVVSGQKAPPMAVAMGKSSVLYLLNQQKLGGLDGTDKGPLQAYSLGCCGVWGGPAYYGAGPNGGLVYYQTGGNVLRAYSVSTGKKPGLTDVADGTSNAGYGGSLPIVSSNGNTPGTAVVWIIRRGTTEALEAYDAVNMGAPLFAANAGTWSNSNGNSFLTAMEANGRVYVPAYKTVTVFGLTQ